MRHLDRLPTVKVTLRGWANGTPPDASAARTVVGQASKGKPVAARLVACHVPNLFPQCAHILLLLLRRALQNH